MLQENWIVDLNAEDESYLYSAVHRDSKKAVKVRIYPQTGPRIFDLKREVDTL
jgi:hypothetical protein